MMQIGIILTDIINEICGKFNIPHCEKNEKTGSETYELMLPCDAMFSQVHGDVKLIYTVYVNEQTIMLNNITPSDILLEGHMAELTTYKGVMISKSNPEKDMFKINLLNMIQTILILILSVIIFPPLIYFILNL